jgi:hypothetical protein
MVMMMCGCSSNATVVRDGKSVPCCAIHAGIKDGWDKVNTNPPKVEMRQAECSYCNRRVPSNIHLAFFEHKPNEPYDKFYCGCRGWD